MTLSLACRIRLTLALLLIALLSATVSSGMVHWPAAPRGASEPPQQIEQQECALGEEGE